ncbi:MAG: M20 family metallopeptidase [Chloroflexi bacterium]|nr:M20 family metallopeptidase [Chloroflexota bacterium]
MDFTAQVPQMLALLKRLVETESPSHDKAAVDRVGAMVAEECRRLGAEVKIHPQVETGDQVEARFHPPPSGMLREGVVGEGSILLLAHMDTVFPLGTLAKMPFYEKDGKVFGPGVSDMKGGIVVALTALTAVLETGSLAHPITALFTSDEEIGSGTSRALIEKLAAESALVLVLEPGMLDGSVKTWRKGVGEFTVRVRGRAAHAGGDHEKGRNAIEEMAHQVLAIQKLTDYNKGTTLNAGVIRGGIASNVVPDEASLEVDLRVMQPGEAERISTAMQALKPFLDGTSLKVTGGLNRPPMPFSDTIKATFEKVKAIAANENIELKANGTGGASDANFVAPLGIPVLDGLGPSGGEYHSEREFIFRDSLSERVKLLAAILREW